MPAGPAALVEKSKAINVYNDDESKKTKMKYDADGDFKIAPENDKSVYMEKIIFKADGVKQDVLERFINVDTNITNLQAENSTQQTAIDLNTDKAGITSDQIQKLSNITITSSQNLDNHGTQITSNTTAITANSVAHTTNASNIAANLATNNAQQIAINLNNAKKSMVIGTTSLTAKAGNSGIKHLLYIQPNTPTYYDMTGTYGAITGSALPSAELATEPRRIVIGSLGIVQDTESPNNFSFSESDTKITFGWSQQVVLVFYKYEYYDNSAGERLITWGLYDDHHKTNKFSIRHSINIPTSKYTFKQISGYAGHIAIQNYANYYLWAKSDGGGKIQGLNLIFIRSGLNF